jgi:hypothetical protein
VARAVVEVANRLCAKLGGEDREEQTHA